MSYTHKVMNSRPVRIRVLCHSLFVQPFNIWVNCCFCQCCRSCCCCHYCNYCCGVARNYDWQKWNWHSFSFVMLRKITSALIVFHQLSDSLNGWRSLCGRICRYGASDAQLRGLQYIYDAIQIFDFLMFGYCNGKYMVESFKIMVTYFILAADGWNNERKSA